MAFASVRTPATRINEARALVGGLASIGLVTVVYAEWLSVTNPTIVALSFLFVVFIVATRATRRVAVATSLLAFLCFNYFFLPPVGTWTVADPQNWAALLTLLAVSLVASHLSAQVRQQAKDATARRDELARLFELTCDILLTTDTTNAVASIAGFVARRFGMTRVTICLPHATGWQFHASDSDPTNMDASALEQAYGLSSALRKVDPLELPHKTLTFRDGSQGTLVPLRRGSRIIGVIVFEDPLEKGTLDAIAGVAAIAIERAALLEERKEAEVVRRGAELKSALLASFSHDLKTPLTALTVAANSLNATWLTGDQRQDQADIVKHELDRLNRLFEDITDMARIDSHAVSPELEWVQPAEIVEAAIRRIEPALEGHTLETDADANGTFVRLDPRLTSAALAHVIENAAQYSPPGSTIKVQVSVTPDEMTIAVRDQGLGIPPDDFNRLFDRFYRGDHARRQRFGTGMGLSITRGLLAAEGGRVWAENEKAGAVFTLAVPAESRAGPTMEGDSL